MSDEVARWIGTLGGGCDLCGAVWQSEPLMIDGRVEVGRSTWANACRRCWERHGVGRFALCSGQLYGRGTDGTWILLSGGEGALLSRLTTTPEVGGELCRAVWLVEPESLAAALGVLIAQREAIERRSRS